MRAILLLLVHLLSRVIRLLGTRGARAVLAENLLLQCETSHYCSRINSWFCDEAVGALRASRPPTVSSWGFGPSFLNPRRLLRTAIILHPATLYIANC